jgi:hypothetical protein
MNRVRLRKITRNLFITAALAFVSAARAEDWKAVGEFGWFGVGKAHEIEKGHVLWVGESSGTFFNEKGPGSLFHLAGVKCPGYNDLDFNNKKGKAGGYCIIRDLDGDQAYLTWRLDGDTENGTGTFDYTGGTGKYKGITGSNKFVGNRILGGRHGVGPRDLESVNEYRVGRGRRLLGTMRHKRFMVCSYTEDPMKDSM